MLTNEENDYSHKSMNKNRSPSAGHPERQVAAGVFKATCLALLDEVARTGHPLVVTKRGRPVARVSPASDPDPRSLLGSVSFGFDLLSPIESKWGTRK
jgi:prevent-host-death family protein